MPGSRPISSRQPRDMRPSHRDCYPAQCNPTTCGIAALAVVSARHAARTGSPFATYLGATAGEALLVQQDIHEVASRAGFPWPQALGTSPWALAALAKRSTGMRYRILRWGRRAVDLVNKAIDAGHDAFVYTGGGAYVTGGGLLGGALSAVAKIGVEWAPRHVVAVLAGEAPEGQIAIFEPTSGRVFRLDREELAAYSLGQGDKERLPHWGYWKKPLLAVVPIVDEAA